MEFTEPTRSRMGGNSFGESFYGEEIVDACFGESHGDGNLWSGGLGVGVYLRIKMAEKHNNNNNNSDSEASEGWLRSALALLWSSIRGKELEASLSPFGHDNGSSHLSLLSNEFVGSRCLLAKVLHQLGRSDEARGLAASVLDKLSELYEKSTERSSSECDCSILFGLAGALQAIWFLRTELGDDTLGRDLALTLSYTILLEGLQHDGKHEWPCGETGAGDSERLRLLWEWNQWPYLGAGTGSVGILYTLLGHTDSEWEDLGDCLPNAKSVVQQAIDDLAECRYESPSSFSGRGNLRDALVGFEEDETMSLCNWTHGAPGYCLLLLKAFEIYGDERYFYHARDLAESVLWALRHPQSGSYKGVGLARGFAGIAYVLLAVGRVDWRDRSLWISRARELAQSALANERLVGDKENTVRPMSLFDGLGGLASLLIDLEQLEQHPPTTTEEAASFPFFASCQASPHPRKLEYKTRPEDHVFARRLETNLPKSSNHTQTTKAARSPTLGGSTVETSPTEVLTASVTTQTPVATTVLRSSGDGLATPGALDVSQLTEPSGLTRTATPQRSFREAVVSPTTPMIPEAFEGESSRAIAVPSDTTTSSSPKVPNSSEEGQQQKKKKQQQAQRKLLLPRPATPELHRFDTRSSSLTSPDRPSVSHRSRAKVSNPSRIRHGATRHETLYNDGSGDCDEAFMTESVGRIQRAEASWIHHFGNSSVKDQRKLLHRRQLGNATPSPGGGSHRRCYRRTVGT